MMMPARPVHVAVGKLFGLGVTDLGDLDVEGQLHARERVVGVDLHVVPLEPDNRHHAILPALIGLSVLGLYQVSLFGLRYTPW